MRQSKDGVLVVRSRRGVGVLAVKRMKIDNVGKLQGECFIFPQSKRKIQRIYCHLLNPTAMRKGRLQQKLDVQPYSHKVLATLQITRKAHVAKLCTPKYYIFITPLVLAAIKYIYKVQPSRKSEA